MVYATSSMSRFAASVVVTGTTTTPGVVLEGAMVAGEPGGSSNSVVKPRELGITNEKDGNDVMIDGAGVMAGTLEAGVVAAGVVEARVLSTGGEEGAPDGWLSEAAGVFGAGGTAGVLVS
jgi:hypothetical protein